MILWVASKPLRPGISMSIVTMSSLALGGIRELDGVVDGLGQRLGVVETWRGDIEGKVDEMEEIMLT